VGSTNQYLKDRLQQENVPLGAAVIADEQTAGRGRLGRAWWSPPGDGLYTSFLVYPEQYLSGLLSLLAGVALVEAIHTVTGLEASLKWPNDVLVMHKKCAGILVEAGAAPRPWAVIGLGVNVAGDIPDTLSHATSLARASGQPLSRPRLWAMLAQRLENWYETWLTAGAPAVLQGWRDHTATLDQSVEVIEADRIVFRGTARDIDEDGALLVETDGAILRRVQSGEVSIRFDGGRYHPAD
jgi:BirA family biotin operon repressor/biotin-[acetyl-CoA-carboxylase] ligase